MADTLNLNSVVKRVAFGLKCVRVLSPQGYRKSHQATLLLPWGYPPLHPSFGVTMTKAFKWILSEITLTLCPSTTTVPRGWSRATSTHFGAEELPTSANSVNRQGPHRVTILHRDPIATKRVIRFGAGYKMLCIVKYFQLLRSFIQDKIVLRSSEHFPWHHLKVLF